MDCSLLLGPKAHVNLHPRPSKLLSLLSLALLHYGAMPFHQFAVDLEIDELSDGNTPMAPHRLFWSVSLAVKPLTAFVCVRT